MTMATTVAATTFSTYETTVGDSSLINLGRKFSFVVPAEEVYEVNHRVAAFTSGGAARVDIPARFDNAVELVAASLVSGSTVAEQAANYEDYDLSIGDGIGGALASIDIQNNKAAGSGGHGPFTALTSRDFTIASATDRIIAGGIAGLTITSAAAAGSDWLSGVLHLQAKRLDYEAILYPLVAPCAIALQAVTVTPTQTVAFTATNFANLIVGVADGAGGAPSAFDTMTTETVALTAGTKRAFTIAPTVDVLTTGQVLTFQITKTLTGAWLPELAVDVYYKLT